MQSNFDRFKKDIDTLINLGEKLRLAMRVQVNQNNIKEKIKAQYKEKADEYIKSLPNFDSVYEQWYSESIALLKQVLPDRVADFLQHYEPSKTRKELTLTTFRIRDFFQGVRVVQGNEVLVDGSAAITHFDQQLSIVKAANARFTSSLFEIRQLIQADLLDSEIVAAEQLAKYKYIRAAGAVAGVVLERHLSQVCSDHSLKITKKNPTISDFNELLKQNDIIEIPQWRFIQHLGDIRNLCDHSKVDDPTFEQVSDLISGVKKITKTVY